MQMEFHKSSAALVVLWAHLKEEALDSKFPQPVKGTAIPEDLQMGQPDEASSCIQQKQLPWLYPSTAPLTPS